jgi:hypothetical protein
MSGIRTDTGNSSYLEGRDRSILVQPSQGTKVAMFYLKEEAKVGFSPL